MDLQEIEAELHRRLDWSKRVNDPANEIGGRVRHLHNVPEINCADGFHMSVQASEFHYCMPRMSNVVWEEVEVGFPSASSELLMPFAEDPETPTDTVYSYVPVPIVVAVIAEHGGYA